MNMSAYLAVGSAVACAAVLAVRAEEWSESTLYITRAGPAQPAVQQEETALVKKTESAQAQPPAATEPAEASVAPAPVPAARALERGIVRAGAASGAQAPATTTSREEASAAAPRATSAAPAGRAPSLLRRRAESPAAAATGVTVDKFVDQNNDGYDDRAQADDL